MKFETSDRGATDRLRSLFYGQNQQPTTHVPAAVRTKRVRCLNVCEGNTIRGLIRRQRFQVESTRLLPLGSRRGSGSGKAEIVGLSIGARPAERLVDERLGNSGRTSFLFPKKLLTLAVVEVHFEVRIPRTKSNQSIFFKVRFPQP